MKVTVSKEGVMIPRKMLGKAKMVEIHREKSIIIVQLIDVTDPFTRLGKEPVETGLKDGSESHDQYLYLPKE